jgi:hypothetical protein
MGDRVGGLKDKVCSLGDSKYEVTIGIVGSKRGRAGAACVPATPRER